MKGNIVNNIVSSLHRGGGLLELVGCHTVRYKNVQSLCSAPETNITDKGCTLTILKLKNVITISECQNNLLKDEEPKTIKLDYTIKTFIHLYNTNSVK